MSESQPNEPSPAPKPFRAAAHYYETLIYAVYYAPRGRLRLYMVASELAQRYLYPTDLVVGIIGRKDRANRRSSRAFSPASNSPTTTTA